MPFDLLLCPQRRKLRKKFAGLEDLARLTRVSQKSEIVVVKAFLLQCLVRLHIRSDELYFKMILTLCG